MTLNELLAAIDTLTAEELQRVHEYLALREKSLAKPDPATLDRVLDALQAGLSDADLDRIEWAMNVESISPADKSAWQD